MTTTLVPGGLRLPASKPRVIVVLVTDLVDSTAHIERLGDGAAESFRRAHFQLLRDAVGEHDGREIKSRGDGLMVIFTSITDALDCAISMQQAVQRQNRHQSELFRIRVGIHVGEAVAADNDYFGKHVVIAARLCDSAGGGQILVSELVRGLAGTWGNHQFHDLGFLPLKGITAPVRAFEVEWEPAGAPNIPLPSWLTAAEQAAFVGREAALACVRKAWEEVRDGGRPKALAVDGEPGVGKSRLCAEFARAVHQQGVTVLLGSALEENLTPYQPFVHALSHYVRTCPRQELRAQLGRQGTEIAALLPEVLERVPDLPLPHQGDPEGQRYRMFESVRSFLVAAAADTPLVLLLEDLHWADKPTMLLFQHLLRSAEQAPLLVLITYRGTDLEGARPLGAALADLKRANLVRRLHLEGLDEAEAGKLIRALAGRDVPRTVASAVYERTDGNPFFITEVVHHMAESGRLGVPGQRRPLDLLQDARGIPAGVKELIGQRLSLVSEICQRVLRAAAVAGREFDLVLLEGVTKLSPDRLLEIFEEALAHKVISEVPSAVGRYRFVHELIRESLYGELTSTRRARLHLEIGQAIESRYSPDIAPHLAELAYHFSAAAPLGGAEKAADYATRAAERASRRLAYEEAVAHYERALRTLDLVYPADERRRCELLLALADSLWSAGETATTREVALRAAEVARRLRNGELLGRAALAAGGRLSGLQIGVLDEALVNLLEEGLAVLGSDETPLRARVLARLAEALTFSDMPERRVQLAHDAVEMGRRFGDPAALANVLRHAHWALWAPDNVEERLAISTEMIALAEAGGDTGLALSGRGWRIVDLMEIGAIDEARGEIDSYARRADELKQPVYLYVAHLRRTMLALLQGRFAEAEELVMRTPELGERAQVATADQVFGAQLFSVRREQGRLAELEAGVKAIAQRYPRVPAWAAALAHLYVETGRLDEAASQFERIAAHGFNTVPRDLNWNVVLMLLSFLCAALRDARRAAEIYELLAPSAHRCIVAAGTAPQGSASWPLGLLAVTMRRWTLAEKHFEDALAMNRRIGSLPWVAHTQHDYACMLRERGAPGDAERALALEKEALDTAQRLGMAGLAGKIRTAGAAL
jgi:class 3 adenylate cyclase/tetratricopeptide (TPR) repeat protein